NGHGKGSKAARDVVFEVGFKRNHFVDSKKIIQIERRAARNKTLANPVLGEPGISNLQLLFCYAGLDVFHFGRNGLKLMSNLGCRERVPLQRSCAMDGTNSIQPI